MDQPPQRSWWSRNWKWFVPIGCLVPLLGCGGLITLILVSVLGAIKSSEVYADALAKAKAHEEVKALLGEPIEAGFWVIGNLEVSGQAGSADLKIPLTGPKGSATLNVVAMKAAGRWQYSVLEVQPAGAGARIDLRSKGNE